MLRSFLLAQLFLDERNQIVVSSLECLLYDAGDSHFLSLQEFLVVYDLLRLSLYYLCVLLLVFLVVSVDGFEFTNLDVGLQKLLFY